MPAEISQNLSPQAFSRIVVVDPALVPKYRELRLRGLREHPEAFGESAESFRAKSDESLSERIRAQAGLGGFILAAVSKDDQMLGTVGLYLNEPGKMRHRGMLWGMYVIPESRGGGIGQLLIRELLARAEEIPELDLIHLAVVTSNQPAFRLYQRMGFTTYGTDPQVIKIGEETFDEYLMVKMLSGNSKA